MTVGITPLEPYKYASLVDGRQNKKKSFIHILNSKKGTVDGHIKK